MSVVKDGGVYKYAGSGVPVECEWCDKPSKHKRKVDGDLSFACDDHKEDLQAS